MMCWRVGGLKRQLQDVLTRLELRSGLPEELADCGRRLTPHRVCVRSFESTAAGQQSVRGSSRAHSEPEHITYASVELRHDPRSCLRPEAYRAASSSCA